MATFNLKIRLLLYTLIGLPLANTLHFSYDNSNSDPDIFYKTNSSDSYIDGDGTIEMTKNPDTFNSITESCGWVSYKDPVPLWNPHNGQQATFSTHFSFVIDANLSTSNIGDGLTFYMSPYPHTKADNSTGGHLCLFVDKGNIDFPTKQVVAVEFDTCKNYWDPDDHHVGINVERVTSVTFQTLDDNNLMKNGTPAYAWITYDTQTLSVYLTYVGNSNTTRPSEPILSYEINLTKFLPSEVAVGFSASTGSSVEIHQILTWDFDSTLDIEANITPSPSPSASPSYYPPPNDTKKILIIIALCVIGLVIFLVILGWYLTWRKKVLRENAGEMSESDEYSKSYSYKSLVIATSNFSDENKLGEGGFGPVFKGVLRDPLCDVAVKRVCNSKRSKEGLEEYKSEVKVLSKLSHRNLVKLKGWCEEKGELLLVYKFMPNGSLSSQLYSKNRLLSWPERYKITLGLASSLNYLHEECERCILHRDIKPGNVLLDSQFDAKLSDFGLARLVDHNHTSKNTLLAGTQGYLAPEYFYEGRASKESDIYSFGVVLLEMACGRPPLGRNDDEATLIEFVWDHYGRQEILQAADERINGEYDEQEMERVLVVGLWCVHPSYIERPRISQAISVLKLSTPLPDLPSNKPSLFYPPLDQYFNVQKLLVSSSSEGLSISRENVTRSSHASSSTNFGSSPMV
ncbi:hypothetical protein LUZ60_005452 [Juncus effusus]|nr:hypothetical protein LUZ60_005452 [Juncus effusus]